MEIAKEIAKEQADQYIPHGRCPRGMGIPQPRTWEEHKKITMSFDEKFIELNKRFMDIANFPVTYNDDVSLERKYGELFGIAVNFQHEYLQTNSPLENTVVELITDIEETQEDYLRSLKTNPHRPQGTAMDIPTGITVGPDKIPLDKAISGGLLCNPKKPYYLSVDLAKGNDHSAYTPLEGISLVSPVGSRESYRKNIIEPMSKLVRFLDSFSRLQFAHKYIVTNNDILNSSEHIPELFSCYPPNLIEIRGKRVWFYHGLEEGLMCWDSISLTRLTNYLIKINKFDYVSDKEITGSYSLVRRIQGLPNYPSYLKLENGLVSYTFPAVNKVNIFGTISRVALAKAIVKEREYDTVSLPDLY